jgi:CP family cyanate transporter-like MFS transporter
MSLAVLALAIAPLALPWVWVTAFGLGTGSIFSLMLTLPLDLRDSQVEIDELTGWMLGLGYVMSAAAPALVGLGRDLTGDFEWPLITMSVLGIAAGLVALSPVLRPAQATESTTAPPARPDTAAARAPAASSRE